jgi:hypothetical protein
MMNETPENLKKIYESNYKNYSKLIWVHLVPYTFI